MLVAVLKTFDKWNVFIRLPFWIIWTENTNKNEKNLVSRNIEFWIKITRRQWWTSKFHTLLLNSFLISILFYSIQNYNHFIIRAPDLYWVTWCDTVLWVSETASKILNGFLRKLYNRNTCCDLPKTNGNLNCSVLRFFPFQRKDDYVSSQTICLTKQWPV